MQTSSLSVAWRKHNSKIGISSPTTQRNLSKRFKPKPPYAWPPREHSTRIDLNCAWNSLSPIRAFALTRACPLTCVMSLQNAIDDVVTSSRLSRKLNDSFMMALESRLSFNFFNYSEKRATFVPALSRRGDFLGVTKCPRNS